MKNTIKFAALGVCALAVSSTAALAASELPAGITTGIALGAPLPEGIYDISIGSIGSENQHRNLNGTNLAYGLPVWLIWSTPWQFAGGRIMIDSTVGYADAWRPGVAGNIGDSWLNTLVEGSIAWNLGNGWNVALRAGAWTPSQDYVPTALGRDYTAFQGGGHISYLANGWDFTVTGLYGSGGGKESVNGVADLAQQADWFNLDITATRKFGKFETGVIAYGSWDLSNSGFLTCNVVYAGTRINADGTCKQSQFAVGGLTGYDFGSFVAQVKIAYDVEERNYTGHETRGFLTIVKPLWNPETQGPLK